MGNTFVIGFVLVALHFVMALYLKTVIGIDIQPPNHLGDWDWFWQTISTADLMAHPFASVWYFHAQPPLYNLWAALLMRLFFPNHIQTLQYSNIIMAALSVGMCYGIAYSFTQNRKLSLLVGLFVGVSPSLFLYEAYMLYDIFVLFFVTASIFLLSLFSMSSSRVPSKPSSTWRLLYLIAFIIVLNILVLSRSLYHLVYLIPGIVVACILADKQWKQLLLVGCCISLLSLGWYAKNQGLFGFFGSSSWMGLGLWNVADTYYTKSELQQLAEQQVIDEVVVEIPVFSLPSRYVPYGFNKTSEMEALSRDDRNNINIPDISKAYESNAMRLIAHDPLRYVRSAIDAFLIFTEPASKFYQLEDNRSKLGWYEIVYAEFLVGYYPFRLVGLSGSFMTLILPLTLIVYAVQLVRRTGFSMHRWGKMIQSDAPLFFTALTIIYTAFIACFFEIGENSRFKLYVEILIWAFIAAIFYRLYLGFRTQADVPVRREMPAESVF